MPLGYNDRLVRESRVVRAVLRRDAVRSELDGHVVRRRAVQQYLEGPLAQVLCYFAPDRGHPVGPGRQLGGRSVRACNGHCQGVGEFPPASGADCLAVAAGQVASYDQVSQVVLVTGAELHGPVSAVAGIPMCPLHRHSLSLQNVREGFVPVPDGFIEHKNDSLVKSLCRSDLEQTCLRLGTIYSLCSAYYPNIR